jgi:hypothetical protein
MRIRRLGKKEGFREFSDVECAWCEAGHAIDWGDETTIHLENDRGGKRTLVIHDDDSMECEAYVFFQDG